MRLVLQMQFVHSPHYSCLLYYFGKYNLNTSFGTCAIGALQETMRVSVHLRKIKCAYHMHQALQKSNVTLSDFYGLLYNSEIKQVVSCGPVKYKPVKTGFVAVQTQINQAIQSQKYIDAQETSTEESSTFLSPLKCVKSFQVPDTTTLPPGADLVIACSKIPDKRDQLLYKSISLYRLKSQFSVADTNF